MLCYLCLFNIFFFFKLHYVIYSLLWVNELIIYAGAAIFVQIGVGKFSEMCVRVRA